MNIDWYRWIDNMIPPLMRKKTMQEFMYLFTFPLRMLYSDFSGWREKTRIKAAGTPQVCILEKIIRDSLGVNVEIVEGNGKPTDFIVKTSFNGVDKERQLFAILDRYKLAGKSYKYENTDVGIAHEWKGFVCELADVTWGWEEFICEAKVKLESTILIRKGNTNRTFIVSCSPDAYPYAYVEISYYCFDPDGYVYSPPAYRYDGGAIRIAQAYGDLKLYPDKPNLGFSIYPLEDETHIYSLKVEIL